MLCRARANVMPYACKYVLQVSGDGFKKYFVPRRVFYPETSHLHGKFEKFDVHDIQSPEQSSPAPPRRRRCRAERGTIKRGMMTGGTAIKRGMIRGAKGGRPGDRNSSVDLIRVP